MHDLAMNKSRWTPIDELRFHVCTLGEYLQPVVKTGTIILMRFKMAKANQFTDGKLRALKAVEKAVDLYYKLREDRGKKPKR